MSDYDREMRYTTLFSLLIVLALICVGMAAFGGPSFGVDRLLFDALHRR